MGSPRVVFMLVFGALAAASVGLRHRVVSRPKVGTDLVLPSARMRSAMHDLAAALGQRAPQALQAVKDNLVTLHRQAARAILYTSHPADAAMLYDDMLIVTADLLSAAGDMETTARDAKDVAVVRSAQDLLERRSHMLLRAVRNKYNIRNTGFPSPSSGTPFFSGYGSNGSAA